MYNDRPAQGLGGSGQGGPSGYRTRFKRTRIGGNAHNAHVRSSFSRAPGAGAGSAPHSSGSRGSFGGNRPFNGGNRDRNRRGKNTHGQFIDINRFINRAVVTETAEIPYAPVHTFADFAVNEKLRQNIVAKGYKLPTMIQDQSIPYALEGRDIIGIADTGSGKTAAFLIPLINKVLSGRNEKVLIVVPTREIALQIQDELYGFSKNLTIYSAVCIGGASMNTQINQLRKGPNFIIGTPGRLKDLVNRNLLNLSQVTNLVLDEADRMLDMGFINDIKFLMGKLKTERQSLFFSATVTPAIESLYKTILRDPVKVSVKTRETSGNVDQDIVRVSPGKDKFDVLHDLLMKEEFNKVLIFGRTKHGVEKLSVTLEKRGFKAASIHGNKNQSKRQKALALFKTSAIRILVATDVAARGLDIADVSHVINYDLPTTYEDYVHRIGRTGRANKKGIALTFVD